MTGPAPIRIGIVGVGRGAAFARDATPALGFELAALCDRRERPLERLGSEYGVATYTDYERFLEHDLDAVILANYSHQHAPFAIRALEAGKHVMSETAACKTLAEGVALCRAVERADGTYLFADNYPYSPACREMSRLVREGEIGTVTYAEGEYNHPLAEERRLDLAPGLDHWRHWLPPTYYCSHALAPLMCMTDRIPLSVNALSIVEERSQSPNTVRVGDQGGVILARMEGGAVFRLLGLNLGSIHRVRYEVHGDRGLIATAEPEPWRRVRVHHEPWLRGEGQVDDRTYPAPEEREVGSAFWNARHLAEAIRSGQPPYLDVYRGVAMAAVGIQAWRSCLADGAAQPVPDFRDEAVRKIWEDDDWSPYPEDAGPGQPSPSIRGYEAPSDEAVERARRRWSSE